MHALYVELNPDAFLCSSVVFHVSCLFPVCKSSWQCLCWVNTGKLYCTCSCYVMFVVYFWGSCWRIESGVSMETTSGYHRRSFSVLQADNWSLISLWYKRTVCKFDYLLRCVCVFPHISSASMLRFGSFSICDSCSNSFHAATCVFLFLCVLAIQVFHWLMFREQAGRWMVFITQAQGLLHWIHSDIVFIQ